MRRLPPGGGRHEAIFARLDGLSLGDRLVIVNDHDPRPLRFQLGPHTWRVEEFVRRYHAELDEPERAAALAHLREVAGHGPVTLLTATKAVEISQAAVLAVLLQR